MPVLIEDWLYQPCTAFLFVHVLWAVIVLRVHEPLSLGLGYKQLNVIPPDKRGLLCSEEVSTVCACFSSGYHLFFSILLPTMAVLYCYLYVHLWLLLLLPIVL